MGVIIQRRKIIWNGCPIAAGSEPVVGDGSAQGWCCHAQCQQSQSVPLLMAATFSQDEAAAVARQCQNTSHAAIPTFLTVTYYTSPQPLYTLITYAYPYLTRVTACPICNVCMKRRISISDTPLILTRSYTLCFPEMDHCCIITLIPKKVSGSCRFQIARQFSMNQMNH